MKGTIRHPHGPWSLIPGPWHGDAMPTHPQGLAMLLVMHAVMGLDTCVGCACLHPYGGVDPVRALVTGGEGVYVLGMGSL